MSFFSAILNKLGLGDAAASTAQAAPASSSHAVASPEPAASAPAAIPTVDVTAKLDGLAAANAQTLNWKVSIVDLLKLLGLDSRFWCAQGIGHRIGLPRR